MREKRKENYWKLWHPERSGSAIGIVDTNGKPTKQNYTLENLISQIKRGVATPQAKAIRCTPAHIEHPKLKDCKTLEELLVPNKKRRGDVVNLRTIPAEIRYKGKVNWRDQKVKDLILKWHSAGDSIRKIAEKLEVTHQALTYANKKHHLYPPRKSPILH